MPTRSGSIHLFRFAGIDLFLHWSWFVFALYEINSRGRYSSQKWNIIEYLTLFVIVMLHEFGHALACRQVGGNANRIVLWPLGGVAYVDPPPRPGATLWSIAAGPLVNVVLLVVSYVIGRLGRSGDIWTTMPDVHTWVRSVFLINLGLLMFNLLPIYPLDGGQILRSLLWFVLGRARSLMVATVVGFIGIAGLIALALYLKSAWFGGDGVFHADELLGRIAACAGAIENCADSATGWLCVPYLQHGPADRQLLEVQPMPAAVRHVPDTRRLPVVRQAVPGNGVSGLPASASDE